MVYSVSVSKPRGRDGRYCIDISKYRYFLPIYRYFGIDTHSTDTHEYRYFKDDISSTLRLAVFTESGSLN